MNATVWVQKDRCDVWVGSQAPALAGRMAAKISGLPYEAVTVHNQYLGGGFGRRSMPDHVAEATAIAVRVDQPVKLIWSREDDTQHDFYRPAMAGKISARVLPDGSITRWRHRIVGPSIAQQILPEFGEALLPQWAPGTVVRFVGNQVGNFDPSSVEGAKELPYDFDGIKVQYHNLPTAVPLGFWRAVGHSHTAFVVESFVDELAHAAGQDPLAFRLKHLPEDSRQTRVLKAVAEAAGWGKAPTGHFQGIAVHESFHSVVAEVAEISLQNGQPRIEKFSCAIDCGQVINPDIVRDQMESGILFALSAAIHGAITLDNGAVQQSNFHDYPVMRHTDLPEFEVILIDSDAPPTGVGEPGLPPAAPAYANAIFAATGKRLRSLPLKLS
jgi:CO/xanthine dehydrogenase Mo-binding subunit